MMLFDITHPAGALTQADCAILTDGIVDATLAPGHAPEETMRKGRAMAHFVFHEAHHWQTGDGPVGGDDVPPVIVTVTVPEAWREEVSRHMIGTVRAAINRVDVTHGWKRDPEALWVNVRAVPDGSIGLGGKASTAADVLAHMTEDYRAARAAGRAQPTPEGKLVDPVCGMLVTPGKGSITIEHDGATVGFCATGCRDAWLREQELPRA